MSDGQYLLYKENGAKTQRPTAFCFIKVILFQCNNTAIYMNRLQFLVCNSKVGLLMKTKRLFICLTMALASFSAFGYERPFPENAKRGKFSMEDYPNSVYMNGRARKLSPGAWIRNEQNMINVPAAYMGREYIVNYTENTEGDIDRVWILNADEMRRSAPSRSQDDQRMLLID
jgi:hypothetical protein